MRDLPEISVIVPVYKEEKNISPFLDKVEKVLERITANYEIIFCLDPSPDSSQEVIQKEINRNSRIKLLLFSRRFGQPAATMAGLFHCVGKTCVVIDVDLQDPPELIEVMYHKLQDNYDVVYAKRSSRNGETFVKRIISYFGYMVINKLSDVQIPRNTGDYRIMTKRVVDELKRLNESHGFLRGLVAYVGFRQTYVEYDRDERISGKGNYNRFTGSLKIGLNGLISFSSKPLQLMSLVGFLISGFSFLFGFWYVIQHLIGVSLTPGLSTTILVITFCTGIQLFSLGIMGEYISRIYDEVKQRPFFIVDQKINFND